MTADLVYAGRIRAILSTEFPACTATAFRGISITRCPFRNLPDRGEGRWGEGLTAAKMVACRWPRSVPDRTHRVSGMDRR